MTAATHLIDTSAFNRLVRCPAPDLYGWREARDAGLLAICDITELEIGRAAGSDSQRAVVIGLLGEMFSWCPTPDGVMRRARQVQDELATTAQHQGPGAIDLLVAATAELSGLTLLHYDKDFQTIARSTDQPHAFVSPLGAVD
ncbi:PIN domain nuclease [Streptacidiphilus sp. EB103A]|uniref:PIN domain nuclease n=1 Tax=Streptacidiphilus sp. EB103A TaxID=3156275 RepID=UPI003516E9FB